ncbi:hypothetical protein FHA94_004719 [Escherichia coli]|nr:hypothetical protein [Escherichia coli]EET2442140.1 hypothetical protein [Escherichia coli]EET4794455.1 hypothetical protein [Escherichia coli]EET4798855.1 hypothetical protein [Escherichia coli]EFS1392731.1 hypothetical protein [Escherichia coli]
MTVKKSAVFVGFADSVWSLQNPPGGTRHHVIDGSDAHTSPSPEGLFCERKKPGFTRAIT